MKNRVILVINNFSWFGKRKFRTWLPAVPIITALVKDICDFSVIDANVSEMTFEQTQNAIKESEADIVMISALSIDYQLQYHKIAELAKNALPKCTTLMGGVYPTVLSEQILMDSNIDIIMQGHAEERLPKILHAIMLSDNTYLSSQPGIGLRTEAGIHITPLNSLLYQVKEMVKLDFSLIDVEGYFRLQKHYSASNYSTECSEKRTINIIASYGCPYNCFFCANRSLSGSHVVYRPVEDILDEIDYFVTEHHIKQISFMDDNIVSDMERAKTLFKAIIHRNYGIEIQIGNLAAWDLDEEMLQLLKTAGCTRIGISVESGSQRVLKEIIHKPLNLTIVPPLVKLFEKYDIMMIADFIIGLPGENWDDIRSSFAFADSMDADLCNFNIAVPYPGTELYTHMKAHNLLAEDFAFNDRFYVTGLVKTEEFTPGELQIIQALEWERINIGTPKRKKRAMDVLRLSEQEIDEYAKRIRLRAMSFIKKNSK